MIWIILLVVFGAGSVGGLLAGLFTPGSRVRDGYDDLPPAETTILPNEADKADRRLRERLGLVVLGADCDSVFPGLVGHVLLGGTAAVVFFGLYGPVSGSTIIGTSVPDGGASLTAGQFASSILVGIAGGAFLFAEASRRCLENPSQESPTTSDLTGNMPTDGGSD